MSRALTARRTINRENSINSPGKLGLPDYYGGKSESLSGYALLNGLNLMKMRKIVRLRPGYRTIMVENPKVCPAKRSLTD